MFKKSCLLLLALTVGSHVQLWAVKRNATNMTAEEREENKDQSNPVAAFINLTVAGLAGALSYVLFQEARSEHEGVSGFVSQANAMLKDVARLSADQRAQRERTLRMTGIYTGSALSAALAVTCGLTGLRQLLR